jgi:hypothetical protein
MKYTIKVFFKKGNSKQRKFIIKRPSVKEHKKNVFPEEGK